MGLREVLKVAVVAWLFLCPCLTIDLMEISMDLKATIEVRGMASAV